MRDTDQIAPGRLELLREFVNTLDVEEGTDALGDPEAVVEWFRERAIRLDRAALDSDASGRLIAVREALRALLLHNNLGGPSPERPLDLLNEEAAGAELRLRFADGEAELVAASGGVEAAIAELLAIAAEAMRDGTWGRLKVCPAEDCQWAFYDTSRNRSGTWCQMGVCGNRAKARSFRERRKAAAAAKTRAAAKARR